MQTFAPITSVRLFTSYYSNTAIPASALRVAITKRVPAGQQVDLHLPELGASADALSALHQGRLSQRDFDLNYLASLSNIDKAALRAALRGKLKAAPKGSCVYFLGYPKSNKSCFRAVFGAWLGPSVQEARKP